MPTNMDSQCITPLVSCDLSVVFDTVNHSILFDVLESCFGVKIQPYPGLKTTYLEDQCRFRSTTKFPVVKTCGMWGPSR